jgi:hypothetical protein
MKLLRDYIKNKPTHALSVPAILCFIQFLTNLWQIIKTGVFDSNAMNQLLSSADGFEAVVLFAIMIALKSKKK